MAGWMNEWMNERMNEWMNLPQLESLHHQQQMTPDYRSPRKTLPYCSTPVQIQK